MCDGLRAAKRQKSAHALAATILIRSTCIHCKPGNHANITTGCQMTLSVTICHRVSSLINIGFGIADIAG